MAAIEVRNLFKDYGRIKAVQDVSFSVQQGHIFGMVGPNGAGKTTTIECMIGLKQPTSGDISVLGMNPYKERLSLYERIGVQLQEAYYQNKIKVWELCRMYSRIYQNAADYNLLLEKLDLLEKKDSYYGKLSGGQKQKLSILLALLPNPEAVFLDELTTGLDPAARRNMWEYIKELRNEGRTVFITTHYMEEAEHLCDKVCVIDDGKIIALGEVSEVINQCQLDRVLSFDSEAEETEETLASLSQVNKVVRTGKTYRVSSADERAIISVICLLEERHISYRNINITRPSLEDAYIKLTGRKL